jgi:hypothetical protein
MCIFISELFQTNTRGISIFVDIIQKNEQRRARSRGLSRGNRPPPAVVLSMWEGPRQGRVCVHFFGAVDISPAFN